MIVPMLKGGLGNQMFQIANAYAHAKRNGFDWGINYGLSICPNQGHTATKYKDNLFSKIPDVDFRPQQVFHEPCFNYTSIPPLDNILLDGYFQSEKYFKDVEDVGSLFNFPQEVKDKVDDFLKKIGENVVGIHIRRGDYKRFSNHLKITSSDYYIQAAKIVQGFKPIVCSDDWDSVNKEMNFKKAIQSPFSDELEDLYLLSQCDALMMCNSSFSWWASYIGKEKSIIIAPSVWFAESGPKEYQDIYREGWKVI